MREPPVQLEIEEVPLHPGQEWITQPNQWRFVFLRSGTAYWLEASKPRELAPGELLVVSPVAKGIIRASQLGEAVLDWFGFWPDSLLGFLSVIEREWIHTRAAATMGPVSCLPSTHPISIEMGALCNSVQADGCLVHRAKVLVLVARVLAGSMPPRNAAPRHGGAAKARFEEIIARMPDAELIQHSSEDLARLCGCTARHFNRLFRMQFGTPTRVRQTELRLLKARQLVENSTQPIAQIAADCGYQSLSFFNSLFRRRFGVSPSQWRNRVSG